MRSLTAKELRQLYLDFFRSKGHAVISSASLIPENDPTVLFTTAGMHPLVPYLMGEKHPEGKRLCDVQKCVRTGDIDEVGDSSHCTFFEMLGNWSLGDYFKKESIAFSWEFLTDEKWLGIPKDKLYFTQVLAFLRIRPLGLIQLLQPRVVFIPRRADAKPLRNQYHEQNHHARDQHEDKMDQFEVNRSDDSFRRFFHT